MSDKKYASIEEFDKEYEELYKQAEKEATTTAETKEVEPATIDVEKAEVAEPKAAVDATAKVAGDETKPMEKPVGNETFKSDKQSYAFEELRKQNSEIKKQLSEKASTIEEIENLAKLSGYDSINELLDVWKKERIKKEAEIHDVDEDFYREYQQTKEKAERYEKEQRASVQQQKVDAVSSEFKKFTNDLKLNQTEATALLNQMEVDGFDIDTLVNLPVKSVGNILKGYAADIIAERKLQERLAKLEQVDVKKENKVRTTTSRGTELDDEFSQESLEKEMNDYKKKNFPWL